MAADNGFALISVQLTRMTRYPLFLLGDPYSVLPYFLQSAVLFNPVLYIMSMFVKITLSHCSVCLFIAS